MTDPGAASDSDARGRPRPARTQESPQWRSADVRSTAPSGRRSGRGRRGSAGSALARLDPGSPAQVAGAAGNALVTVGRVGRLLTRSGLRLARQVPMVALVENQAQRVAVVAAAEFDRLLQIPQQLTGGAGSADEQRVVALVHSAHDDPEPLRTAMSELLDRSVIADDDRGREYLFGSIVSQLVPDEARMLAALATGRPFAAVDVLARQSGRSGKTRPVLTNASTLGAAAGVAVPQNTPTYLSRLHSLGLVEFASAASGDTTGNLTAQFDSLRGDPEIRAARDEAEQGKQTSAKVVRKIVRLSPLGREFWQACAPPAPGTRR